MFFQRKQKQSYTTTSHLAALSKYTSQAGRISTKNSTLMGRSSHSSQYQGLGDPIENLPMFTLLLQPTLHLAYLELASITNI